MTRTAPLRTLAGLVALVGVLLLAVARSAAAAPPNPDSPQFAEYVMKQLDDMYRGNSSHGVMEMRVKTKHWTRTLSMESWSYGTKHSLIRILSPKKEKGTATLKADKDLFTYLSKTGRVIKITGGMMGGSWMGSHFTNDDLVQDSRRSEDYTISKTFSGTAGGTLVHRFRLTPKPNAAVVWGKIEVDVRQSDLQPVNETYFDEDGVKVRVLEWSNHRDVGGKTIATRMMMRPLDGSGEFTEVRWKKIDFKANVDRSFFTLQKLKSM